MNEKSRVKQINRLEKEVQKHILGDSLSGDF